MHKRRLSRSYCHVREGRFRTHTKTVVFKNNGRRGGLPPMWWSVRVTFGPGGVYPPQSYGGGGLPPVVVVMPPPGLPPAAVSTHSATVSSCFGNCGTLPCRGLSLLQHGGSFTPPMWSLLSGGVYPPLLCVVTIQMRLTPVYLPHQIARGGRDLGGANPPIGPSLVRHLGRDG